MLPLFVEHDEAARCLKNINKCINETRCPCSTPGEAIGKREDNGGGLESAPKRLRHGPQSGLGWPRPVHADPPGLKFAPTKLPIRMVRLCVRVSNLLHLDTERLSDTDEWKNEKGLAWSS